MSTYLQSCSSLLNLCKPSVKVTAKTRFAISVPLPEKVHAPVSIRRRYSSWEASLAWLEKYRNENDVVKATNAIGFHADLWVWDMAKEYGFGVENEHTLQSPANSFFYYLDKNIEAGQYIIDLGENFVALVKDVQGGFYLFVPSIGCVDMRDNEKWFIRFLVAHKVHMSETLVIKKMGAVSAVPTKSEFISPSVLEEADYHCEPNEGQWAKAIVLWHNVNYTFVKDTLSGDVYNNDSVDLVRFKCACLIPATVVSVVASVISNIATGIFHLFSADITKAQVAFKKVPQNLYYGTRGIAYSFYGLFKPYEARSLYSQNERSSNNDELYVDRKKAYLAHCFLPLNCNSRDKTNNSMTLESLKKTILWNKYL